MEHMKSTYDAFKANFLRIEAHNTAEPEAPFQLGINQFSDMTEEEFVAERLSAKIMPAKLTEERKAKRI